MSYDSSKITLTGPKVQGTCAPDAKMKGVPNEDFIKSIYIVVAKVAATFR